MGLRRVGFAFVLATLVGCGSSGDETGEAAPGAGGSGGADAGTVEAGGHAADAGPADGSGAGPDAAPEGSGIDATADTGVDATDAGSDAPSDAGSELAPFDGGPAAACFANAYVHPPTSLGPNYDQFSPTVGSHCMGTNMQDIANVQRVVFLGDSITVGTPPTLSTDVYRAKLAAKLAQKFNLAPPDLLWDSSDPINGVSLKRESGDFASCAKWGARTDDLMKDNTQIADCIPPDKRSLHHLVIITDGGNDIASITKAGLDGKPIPDIWLQVQDFVANLRAAVAWLKDPANVPGGVDVIFGNNYEFTDGTADTASCPGAALAGFSGQWSDPNELAKMVIWANEQYMKIAVDTKSDMIFMLESFCGHGFHNADPNAPCYRGPNTPQWFDLTCIHPNPTGHDVLANMFMSVVDE